MADEDVQYVRDDVESMSDRWQRVADVYGGSDRVKAQGVKYLPLVSSEMTAAQYNAYKSRALFFNALKRTVEGLTGMIFRKPIDVQRPDGIAADFDAQMKNVTGSGDPMMEFASSLVRDHLLQTGRVFVWIDMPAETVTNGRPYWRVTPAEQFINWRTEIINGEEMLTLAVLHEFENVQKDDNEFAIDIKERYRVLRLGSTNAAARVYTVQTYDVVHDEQQKRKIVAGPVVIPVNAGRSLDFIPAVVINASGLSFDVSEPPLLDLVDVNLSHYQSSADLEHGRHMTGLPTPWVVGAPKTGRLLIGSGTAWILEGQGAQAGMLEFTGQGLGALENALADKEAKMAHLGSRPVENASRSGVEAAETVRLRQSAETASLANVAGTTSRALTKLARLHAWWSHMTTDPNDEAIAVTLNTDFLDSQIDPTMLREMVNAVGLGQMSFETFWYNLQRGEIAPEGVTVEDERKRIEADGDDFRKPAPTLPPGADPADDDADDADDDVDDDA